MKKFKFLLIPKSNNFREIININEISYQLKNLGHNCFTLKSQISDDNLNFILEEEKFDFVFRVNKGKPKKINKKIRFISWVRQISDLKESLDNFNDNDLIYTLKKTLNNHKLKINQLLPAANNFNNECNYDSWAWDPRNGKELYRGSYIPKRSNRNTHNFALNGYWVPLYSNWIPSVSLGYSRSVTNGDGFFDGSPLASNSWFAATKWDDVLYSGNDLGISFGQPNFSTDHPQDSNYLLEIYSSFKVSNNIDITPSIFWLSKPLGSFTANLSGDQNQDGSSKFGVFGGLIQSVFRF